MTRKATASRSEPRTATAELPDGPYAGWSVTVRADFKARILADLTSTDVDRILSALRKIVLDHNLPDDETGERAADLADVDYGGLMAVAGAAMTAIQRLPPR